MTASDLGLLAIGATGLLLWALGRGMRRVRPNRLYGVRTPSTFADERVWRDANRRAGRHMERLGLGFVLLCVALVPAPDDAALGIAVVAILVGTLAFAADSVLYARRRLRWYREQDAASG